MTRGLPHVLAEVDRALAVRPARLRPVGDGVHYAGPDDRFQVVDESRWMADVVGPRSNDRWSVRDRSMPTSGCPNDDRNVVARVPTKRRASEVVGAALAADDGAPRSVRTWTPRGAYQHHLLEMLDARQIDVRELHDHLAAWDQQHC